MGAATARSAPSRQHAHLPRPDRPGPCKGGPQARRVTRRLALCEVALGASIWGLMVRDASLCDAPHHEGLDLILRSGAAASRRMKPPNCELQRLLLVAALL